MGFYVALFIGLWVVTMLAWWMISSAFRTAEVDRMKDRLLGTTPKKKGRRKIGNIKIVSSEASELNLKLLVRA